MSAECYHFRVGGFECIVVRDGTFTAPASYFFTNAPPDALAMSLKSHNLQADRINLPIQHLLVDTGHGVVLIDTGMGTSGSPEAGFLRRNLEREGVSAEDIDVVILSHGHSDHIGGLTREDGSAAFPNARYVMGKQEWEFWRENNNLAGLADFQVHALHANLPAVQDRLQVVENEAEIIPGIDLVSAPGHSLGQMIVSISSGGEQLLDVVDTAVHPIHLEHPAWIISGEHDPRAAEASRRRIFGAAAREKRLLFACHFPFPGLGYVAPAGEGWEWQGI